MNEHSIEIIPGGLIHAAIPTMLDTDDAEKIGRELIRAAAITRGTISPGNIDLTVTPTDGGFTLTARDGDIERSTHLAHADAARLVENILTGLFTGTDHIDVALTDTTDLRLTGQLALDLAQELDQTL